MSAILDIQRIDSSFLYFTVDYNIFKLVSIVNISVYTVIKLWALSRHIEENTGVAPAGSSPGPKQAHAGSMRINTHKDNGPIQHVLEGLGFAWSGIIYLEDRGPRVSYQYVDAKSPSRRHTGHTPSKRPHSTDERDQHVRAKPIEGVSVSAHGLVRVRTSLALRLKWHVS